MPFDNPFEGAFGDIQILMDARSHISSKGDWVKGCFRNCHRHCLVAALSVVAGSPNFNTPNRVERRLAGLLAAQLPSGSAFWARMRFFTARQRLMWFNDDPRTKHEDVMALFDRAVDHLTSRVPAYILA